MSGHFPRGGGRGNGSSSGRPTKRKRGSGYQDAFEARRDALKLLVPLDEAESRVYPVPAPDMVTLPEKSKDDVFSQHHFGKHSTIDVASDDVNWYSVNKLRPRHATGYVAKVAVADLEAAHALAATMIKLANEHKTGVILCWFEYPGSTSGASRSKKAKLTDERGASLSLSVTGHDKPAEDGCAHCKNPGHVLAQCPKPNLQLGNIGGCPLHNTELHSLDNCPAYAGKDLSRLSDDEVVALYKMHVFGRAKMPGIRSERFFWLDCLREAAKRNVIPKALRRSAANELPWSDDYARHVASLKPNSSELSGNPTPAQICTVDDPAGFWKLLPADPFWAKKSVADVIADHANGKLEHLRWAPFKSEKAASVRLARVNSIIAPTGPSTALVGNGHTSLADKDKRNIMIDLRREPVNKGLLTFNGTILLPEEARNMTPMDRLHNDGLDLAHGGNRDSPNHGSDLGYHLSFDTVRRVVSRYRRCKIDERHWDCRCPVERLLMDMVAAARSYQEFSSQRSFDR